ncbi:hypothetical protein GGER_47950 [Serratia rubidaea]
MIAAAVVVGLLWKNGDASADNVADDQTLTSQPPSAADAQAVIRGKYVAIAGDCVACHTAPGSKQPFSGGYPISTPFGSIYASNITPDVEDGIGGWSERDFFRAVRHGKGKQGRTSTRQCRTTPISRSATPICMTCGCICAQLNR